MEAGSLWCSVGIDCLQCGEFLYCGYIRNMGEIQGLGASSVKLFNGSRASTLHLRGP